MRLTDGRGETRDLGPRCVLAVSQMKLLGSSGSTDTGGWARDMSFLFTKRAMTDEERRLRRNAQNRAYRAANPEHHRALDRERHRRYREQRRNMEA